VLTDANGLPLAVLVDAANTPETRMGLAVVARTLALLPRGVQTPVLADKAYDDDWLREQFERLGLVLVAKHRCNRVKPATSDGRRERRLKRRWKVERTNAWLHSYRRAMTRYEKSIRRYEGFVSLACAFIALGKLVRPCVMK
jgi:transposase